MGTAFIAGNPYSAACLIARSVRVSGPIGLSGSALRSDGCAPPRCMRLPALQDSHWHTCSLFAGCKHHPLHGLLHQLCVIALFRMPLLLHYLYNYCSSIIMIQLLATAAVLSCGEAKDLVRRIDSSQFTRKEYAELVDVVQHSTRRDCKLNPKPTVYRHRGRPRRRMHRPYRYYPYWSHPGVRPGWRRPVIRFRHAQPTFVFRF